MSEEQKTFTQDQVNQIAADRVKSKDQEIAQLTQERDNLQGRVSTYKKRLVEDAAERTAGKHTREGSTDRVLKHVNLEDVEVGEDGQVDTSGLETQIEGVVSEFPEFRPPDIGRSSVGAPVGQNIAPLSRKDLEGMTAQEIAQLPGDEVSAALGR